MNQAYSRLSTTHGHITDCKLVVCVYWTRLVLVRPAASLYSATTPLTCQGCPDDSTDDQTVCQLGCLRQRGEPPGSQRLCPGTR